MKNILYTIILSLLFSFSVFGDWEAGVDAVDKGDHKTALKEFTAAAKQGDAFAQGNLGVLYAFGKVVLKDYIYAHMFGNIATTYGNKLGAKLRDDFEKLMTPADISATQKLARECIRKKYKDC